jgi:hypothetical protein
VAARLFVDVGVISHAYEITEIENHNACGMSHDGAMLIERTTSPMRAPPASRWRELPPGFDAARMRSGGHAGHHQR